MSAELPRLYVVTRRPQIVLPDDRPNLVQAGLRGLLRVIGAENPELRTTQIDLEDDADVEQVAQELLAGSAEDETAWRGGHWYTARLRSTPLGPDERRVTTVKHESDRMRADGSHIPATCGHWNSLRCNANRRDRARWRSRSTHPASTSSTCWPRWAVTPIWKAGHTELGFDFGGVVSRVGADVTDLQVGDRVGGFSGYANGCWGTLSPATPGWSPPCRPAWAPARPPLRQRVTAPPGTACATWPG